MHFLRFVNVSQPLENTESLPILGFSKNMNCIFRFSSADIAKLWCLKVRNVKLSDSAEQINRGNMRSMKFY